MTDFRHDDSQDAITPDVAGPPTEPEASADTPESETVADTQEPGEPETLADTQEPGEPETLADTPEPGEPETAAEPEAPTSDAAGDALSEPPLLVLDDEAPSEPSYSAPHDALSPPHVGAPLLGLAPPPIRRIYRSRHDRKLGGVSGGIAEFFRIDPTIVRLATLVLAIPGIGILVYLVAWVIIPLRPEGHIDPASSHPTATDRNVTIALGVTTLALGFGIITGSWVILAFALVGGGVWLLSQSAQTHAPSTTQGFAADSGRPVAYAPPQPPPGDRASYEPTAGFQPQFARDLDRPRRERTPQRVTWIVLALLMLLAAAGITAAAGDWWDVSGVQFLGAALFVLAVGVVVGQVRGGGARGLIPLAVLAALALFPVSLVDGLLGEGVGAATYRPTNIMELESTYEHGIGELVVDLSQLDFDERSETIDIDLGIGELIVIVSDEAGGRATLQAKAGEVSHRLPNTGSMRLEQGLNVKTGTLVLGGDNGMLELNISVGFGSAELRAAAD